MRSNLEASFYKISFFAFCKGLFAVVLIFGLSAFFVNGQDTDTEKDPLELFNKAQSLHEKGKLEEAVKLYREAIGIAPEFPEAEFQLGNALLSLGNEPDAEKSFRRAIELRPTWALPITSLGELLVRAGKFAEAESLLINAIELDSNNTNAYLSLTEIRLRKKSDALHLGELLKKLDTVAVSDSAIWAARGAIQRKLGDLQNADVSIDKSLSLDRKNSFAIAEKIEILLAKKDLNSALTHARQIFTYYPKSLNAKLILARVLAANGNTDEAFGIIDTLDSNKSEVLTLRNEIISKSTSDIPVLEKELAGDSKNPMILARLCVLTRTNPVKSLEYCRRASEADPANVVPAIGFAAALVQAKQFESAVTLLRKLSPFDPENFAIHTNLATALFELKRYSEAKIEYEWIISKQPELSVAYYFLAIVHDNLAEYPQALTNYQRFLQLADAKQNQLEIEKIQLRLPILEKQIKNGEGVKKGKKKNEGKGFDKHCGNQAGKFELFFESNPRCFGQT